MVDVSTATFLASTSTYNLLFFIYFLLFFLFIYLLCEYSASDNCIQQKQNSGVQ